MMNNSSILSFRSTAFYNGLYLFKLGLYLLGFIDFSTFLNLCVFTLTCIHVKWSVINKCFRTLVFVLVFALFYRDSYLPTIEQMLNQKSNLQNFSLEYVIEFAKEFINIWMILALPLAIAAVKLASIYIRPVSMVYIIMIAVNFINQDVLQQLSANDESIVADAGDFIEKKEISNDGIDMQRGNFTQTNLNSYFDFFFENERKRKLTIKAPENEDYQAFNIVFLDVDSLSNEDLSKSMADSHPAMRRFDIYLTNFFTATTDEKEHSLRLLNSLCGQKSREELLEGTPNDSCLLFKQLNRLGYTSQYLFSEPEMAKEYVPFLNNHSFLGIRDVESGIGADFITASDSDLNIFKKYIYDSLRNPDPTVTYMKYSGLNHSKNLVEYNIKLIQLMAELDTFIDDLEKSPRMTLLVLIPSHGSSLRSDLTQLQGSLQIPSKRLCLGSAMLKLVSHKSRLVPVNNQDNLSYLALGHIIKRIIDKQSFNEENIISVEALTEDLQRSAFLGENKEASYMVFRNRQFYKKIDSIWTEYKD